MKYDLKVLTQVVGLFASWVCAIGAGIAIGTWRPATECASFQIPPDADSVKIEFVGIEDRDRATRCLIVKGYFKGRVEDWRYVGVPQ